MWARMWHSLRETVTNRDFWILLGWSLVALGVFGYLMWFAVKTVGSFTQVTPIWCRGDELERRVMVLVFAGPFFGVSVMAAIGELWNVLEQRRAGRRARLRDFFLYALLVFVLSAVILLALSC